MEANSPNRRTSATTIVSLRSSRSATTPANGPKISAGSSRTIRTEPIAYAFSEKPACRELASAVVASRPIQSPRLDSVSASHSRRNCGIRRTARMSPSVLRWESAEPAGGDGTVTTGGLPGGRLDHARPPAGAVEAGGRGGL